MDTKTATARNARLPPKRGQIKVRIISKFVKMVVGAASKAVRGLGRKKRSIDQLMVKVKPNN
ncbi:hypothetical protein I3843_09G177500 [Carya illinoinensis]|nr:hypothetical protein I3843_09G177500 [Carya illinoinensis]